MIRLVAFLVLLAGPAAAHGNLPGGGGFAAGFAHPFLATEHLLALVALGLLIGRQTIRAPVLALLGGLVAGVALGMVATLPVQALILAGALAIGALIASNLRLPDMAVMLAAGVIGLMVGADTDGLTGATAAMAFAGTVVGVLAIVLNCMALAQAARTRLDGVPLRVAGSWIAAAAVLILAFLLRGGMGLA